MQLAGALAAVTDDQVGLGGVRLQGKPHLARGGVHACWKDLMQRRIQLDRWPERGAARCRRQRCDRVGLAQLMGAGERDVMGRRRLRVGGGVMLQEELQAGGVQVGEGHGADSGVGARAGEDGECETAVCGGEGVSFVDGAGNEDAGKRAAEV